MRCCNGSESFVEFYFFLFQKNDGIVEEFADFCKSDPAILLMVIFYDFKKFELK